MDLIPRVRCPKCGTEYSALQSRCPKCGTRKMKQTQRAPGNTAGTVSGTYSSEQAAANARWQMTFAAILVVAVILATIVLITTSLNTEPGSAKNTPSAPVTEDVSPTPTPSPSATTHTGSPLSTLGDPTLEVRPLKGHRGDCEMDTSQNLNGSEPC